MPTTVQSGQTLGGRYLVREKLGEGGWGAVFSAVQTDLGRQVAVKVLHEGAAFAPDALVRFEREARAAAALGHPNIAQVTDFQSRPGEPPFLVMELLPGATLAATIAREGRLSAPRVAWVGYQILAALEAAHGAGIVHRDVKPDNVFLVSASGVVDFVKLLDFGIAKLAEDGRRGAEPMTANGAMMGSPAYMAPEQITTMNVDARTDLYAVGATMYRALTGSFPFDATNLHALLLAITTQPLRPVGALAPNVDPALAAIVERALAKEPASRFASAAEMRAALEPWTHANRRGARAGTAAMAPIVPTSAAGVPSAITPSSPLAGTASPTSPYAPPPGAGTSIPASPHAPSHAAPAASAVWAAPPPAAPAPATVPAPSRGAGAIVAVVIVLVLVGLGGIAWIARDRLLAAGDPAKAPPSVDASAPVATAPVTAVVTATASPTAPATTSPVAPGVVRPPPRVVDAGAPLVAPAVVDAGAPLVTPAVVDAGAPSRKQYGAPKARLTSGTFGGDADHDYITPTKAAVARVQPRIDVCFAAFEFVPPDHQFPSYAIDLAPSGRPLAVRRQPEAARHPQLDTCVMPILKELSYPARPAHDTIILGFQARNRDNP